MQCRKIRRAGKYDPESICFNCSGELQKKSPLFDRGQSTQSGRILQRIVQHNTNKNWAKDFHKRIWRPSGGVQTLINTEQWPHLRGCSVCSPVYVCLFFWFRVWFSNKTAHKWDAQMDGHLSDFDTVWLINVAHGRRSEKQPVFFFLSPSKSNQLTHTPTTISQMHLWTLEWKRSLSTLEMQTEADEVYVYLFVYWPHFPHIIYLILYFHFLFCCQEKSIDQSIFVFLFTSSLIFSTRTLKTKTFETCLPTL